MPARHLSGIPIAQRVRAPIELAIPSPRHQLLWRPLRLEDEAQLVSLMTSPEDSHEAALDLLSPVLVGIADIDSEESGRHGATLGGFDRAGVLRAAGILHLWPDTTVIVLHGAVDPAWSGRGIGGSLMAWQEGRARQILAALPGEATVRMVAYVSESAANRRRLLMAAGFSQLRSMFKMRRDLEAPIPCHPLPAGLKWRPLERVDPEAVRQAHNVATRGAWAPGPIYPALWVRRWADYRPELSCVAFDPAHGRVVGYALSLVERPTSQMTPRSEATIHRLAVAPDHRGRGIGRALMSRALAQIGDDGRRFAASLLDPAMPHSGRAMFEDFGFSPGVRAIAYGLDL
ncbi:MAG: GNAT family N-acetyltransferase [Bifidobacteriaceae bacterium]|jgi:GNAT superfamily N-acetyltransferase|nr:GNAT family N-acetyltransferase [Bifidobacteriaceae bacterium]